MPTVYTEHVAARARACPATRTVERASVAEGRRARQGLAQGAEGQDADRGVAETLIKERITCLVGTYTNSQERR